MTCCVAYTDKRPAQ